MSREYVNPKELLESKSTIMVQFCSAHYEGVILNNKAECNLEWPEKISCSTFEPNADRRNSTLHSMIS